MIRQDLDQVDFDFVDDSICISNIGTPVSNSTPASRRSLLYHTALPDTPVSHRRSSMLFRTAIDNSTTQYFSFVNSSETSLHLSDSECNDGLIYSLPKVSTCSNIKFGRRNAYLIFEKLIGFWALSCTILYTVAQVDFLKFVCQFCT